MKRITQKKMESILKKHTKWLEVESGGERAVFNNVDMSGVDIIDTDLRKVVFNNVDMSRVNMSFSNLSNVGMWKCKLVEANLEGVLISDVVMQNCEIKRASIDDADITKLSILRSDLSEVNFSHSRLKDSYMNKCNLSNASFYNASLIHSNLTCCDMSEIYLEGADVASSYIHGLTVVVDKYTCHLSWEKGVTNIRMGCIHHTVERWENDKEKIIDSDKVWWNLKGQYIYEFLKGEALRYKERKGMTEGELAILSSSCHLCGKQATMYEQYPYKSDMDNDHHLETNPFDFWCDECYKSVADSI